MSPFLHHLFAFLFLQRVSQMVTSDVSTCALSLLTLIPQGKKVLTVWLAQKDIYKIHFAYKGPSSKIYGFSSRCESWTIKKAECWKIDAFSLWCWRRLLRVHWTARRSNQSVLKEISPEYSWEGLMLKLKLQYFDPPDVKNWFIGKDPDARKDWRQEEKGTTEDGMVGWHHRLDGHEFEQTSGDSGGQRGLACYSQWGWEESDMT